ncbi:hypothetical protein L8C07_00495 [Paenibacillus sp. CMAA1739]|nr:MULTISPECIES: hypothetical protein [Paenibacillus]MDP1512498.1 hypothetical protein [Paenibacillus ottowii]MEC4564408.1 hypothetical protein [Paenibacillus sp. CMAA1739]
MAVLRDKVLLALRRLAPASSKARTKGIFGQLSSYFLDSLRGIKEIVQ